MGEIICPNCKHNHIPNGYELRKKDTDTECQKCGCEIKVQIKILVTYLTFRQLPK